MRCEACLLLLFALLAGAISLADIKPTNHPTKTRSNANEFQESKKRPIAKNGRGYISSENCRQCHTEHYDSWYASHHRTMTQVPSKDSVIADFNNRIVRRAGFDFRFFNDDGEYFMEYKKSDQPSMTPRKFKIVLSTGAHHQQAFWCETDNGRTLAKLPFIWINAEQRWVPYGSIFFIPKSGLSMHAGMWNNNCIKCHVVGGRPKLDSEKKHDTDVAEFGISCEACHGPGETHALENGAEGFSDQAKRNSVDKYQLVNPAKLSHQRSSQTCGQCHSVFEFFDTASKDKYNEQGFAFRPGNDLHKSRHVFRMGQDSDLPIVKETLEQNPKFFERQFWSDGMVRVSGREYNGLLETPCYQRGKMSCLSCHDMHPNDLGSRKNWADDQLKHKMRGNSACIQCHSKFKDNDQLLAHTHHAENSTGSNCYNCHMPHTTLGLMKAMRSHTIDSPSVATTLKTGRPNACNLCHLDKSLDWTAKRLKDWYQIQPPALNKEQREIASSVRWLLQGDAGQRAIVGWHFGWQPAQIASGVDWMPPFLAELLVDSYDVVRFIGFHALNKLPNQTRLQYDYVGPENSQKQASDQVVKEWADRLSRPNLSKSVLIDESGQLDVQRYRNLRRRRKDPTVILIE